MLLGGLFCLTAAVAQPVSDSLLARYRQMALAYNDDLKAAQKNIEAGIELERAARADRMPSLGAGANFRYTGNPYEYTAELPNVGELSFQGRHVKYGASASLMQPVYTGGRILETIRLAQSQRLVAEAQQDLLHAAVCYQTDVLYWTAVARFELLGVAREFRNAVADLARIVGERVEEGMCDRQELLTVEVKLNEAEYQLLQAQSEFEIGRMALNSLIGVPLEAETPVGAVVAEVGDVNDSVCDLSLRPEVRIAREKIRMEWSSLRANDARYKPQLYVGADAGYLSPGYDFRPDLSSNYAVYAQLSVPIYEGGRRRSEKRAGEKRAGMAADELHRVESEVELQTRTAWTALGRAEQRVELSRSSLEKARENERRATEEYEEGAISLADVIDAQVYRQTAQTNDVTARAEAQLHLAELLKALHGYGAL